MAAARSALLHPGYQHADAWDSGHLPVGNIHKLWYEQYGKKDGKPVIFLHGGPGGHTSKASTVYFDPAEYRVILFDQRGAGRSLPNAELAENTSNHLVADIEFLREHFGIDKWHVFGGSWGSTLALLYAQAHPDRVASLVLRGIFAVRKEEIAFSRGPVGAASLFPEEYEHFVSYVPESDREGDSLFQKYYEMLRDDDRSVRLAAARAWNRWEMSMGCLIPAENAYANLEDEEWCLAHARLESHYVMHDAWMEEGQLLMEKNLERIRHIPTSIVQGRYDIVCAPFTAYELHKGLPGSELYMIPDAGHSASEPGTRNKLIEVCDEYALLKV